jgi:hypothetical protein
MILAGGGAGQLCLAAGIDFYAGVRIKSRKYQLTKG